jgi:PAS domain S-box-containing protein
MEENNFKYVERKRLGEALRESEEKYRNLFENVSAGIYRTTPDGRVLMANPALVRMLGYFSFDELASHNLEDKDFMLIIHELNLKNSLIEKGRSVV